MGDSGVDIGPFGLLGKRPLEVVRRGLDIPERVVALCRLKVGQSYVECVGILLEDPFEKFQRDFEILLLLRRGERAGLNPEVLRSVKSSSAPRQPLEERGRSWFGPLSLPIPVVA